MNNSMREHELLTEFYQDMQTWVDAGTPEHPIFSKAVGLCANLYWWTGYNKLTHKARAKINLLRRKQFIDAGLNTAYPFNTPIHYLQELRRDGTRYNNKERLAWIREHAECSDYSDPANPAQPPLEGF